MTQATVSVVIVSQDRAETLSLCLKSLLQQRDVIFEVVLVSDPTGLGVLRDLGLVDRVKHVPFEVQNISAARNLGISQSTGDLIAFIDDDAVAPARWLAALTSGFDDPTVDAVGGHVLGPDGVRFQWTSRQVHTDGSCTGWDGTPGAVVKTEGTNMAVRRRVLTSLGGFSEQYAFYLDETDLNMRLHAGGYRTIILPNALVHHGYAASARRRADRVPTDLSQISSSQAVFMGRYLEQDRHDAVWHRFRADQRRRLLRWMVSGHLEPRDVARILKTLNFGYQQGQRMAPPNTAGIAEIAGQRVLFFDTEQAVKIKEIEGWRVNISQLCQQAKDAVAQGFETHVYVKGITYRRPMVRFQPDGAWWHFTPLHLSSKSP